MNQEIKKYTVSLAGQQYTIKSDENPESIEKAAALVDAQIKNLQENAPTLSLEKCALLVALGLARKLGQQDAQDAAANAALQKMCTTIDKLLF